MSAADEGGRRVAQNGIGPAVGVAGCQKAVLEEQSGWSGKGLSERKPPGRRRSAIGAMPAYSFPRTQDRSVHSPIQTQL